MEHKSENNNDKEDKPTELFIHGLHPDTEIKDLIETFRPYCEISNITFKRHPITGKHRGFAFFMVPNGKIAKKILSKGHKLKERTVFCQLKSLNPNFEDKNKKRLFIGGIPKSATDNQLKRIFEKFGKVRTAYTIVDYEGKSKYFGYVDFEEEEGAKKALDARPIKIKGRVLDVKQFEKPGEKKEKSKKQKRRINRVKENNDNHNDNNSGVFMRKNDPFKIEDRYDTDNRPFSHFSDFSIPNFNPQINLFYDPGYHTSSISGSYMNNPNIGPPPSLLNLKNISQQHAENFQFRAENQKREILMVSKMLPESERNYRFNKRVKNRL